MILPSDAILNFTCVISALIAGASGDSSTGTLVTSTKILVWPGSKFNSKSFRFALILLLLDGLSYVYVTVCVKSEIPFDVKDIVGFSPNTLGVYSKSKSSSSIKYPLFPHDVV